MAAAKGKQGTKGSKQIKEENKQTFNFYSYIIVGGVSVVLLYQFLLHYDEVGWTHTGWLLFSGAVHALCMKTMSSMSASGLDLNMSAGVGEHVKDVIIVTVVCQVASCVSFYFWLLWLVIPAAASYKLWVSVLAPWVFAPAPEVTDKQRKKMERKRR